MRAPKWLRLGVVLLALWGAGAAGALWAGALRIGSPKPVEAAPSSEVPGTVVTSELPAAPAPPPQETADPHAAAHAPVALKRHRVCTAEGQLALLRVQADPRPRYLVHCGATVELLGFDEIAGTIEPRRVAHFEVNIPEPGLGAEPGGLASGDLDADGVHDLIIGSVLRDDRGTLGGGRLHWLRGTADGGFAPAKRIADVPAVALRWLRTAADARPELVALGAAEPRRGEASRLWHYGTGAAPALRATVQLSGPASQFEVLDLDRDGRDEAFVLVGTPAALHRIRFGETSTGALFAAPADASARELAVTDMTGDAAGDLVVLGDDLRVFAAGPGADGEQATRVLPEAATLRDLQPAPMDTKTPVAFFAYAHPDLFALERDASGDLARRAVFQRRSALVGTRNLRVDNLDADPDPELLLFGTSPDTPGVVELIVVHTMTTVEQLEPASTALPDAPLSLRGNLP